MTTFKLENWKQPSPPFWKMVGDVTIYVFLPVATLAISTFVPVGPLATALTFGVVAISTIVKGLTKLTFNKKKVPLSYTPEKDPPDTKDLTKK
jgi:hypothetical protein